MQRARRLASTAVAAALGVGGLSACRAEPDVAAYVGPTAITEQRVNQVYTDAQDKLAAAVDRVRAQQGGAAAPEAQDEVKLPFGRADVVTTLVGLDVLRTVAQQRNVTATALPAAQLAQSLNLPPDAEYVNLYGEYRGYLDAFAQKVTPVEPTDADLRDVFTRLSAGGVVQPGTTFADFSGSISPQDRQTLRQNIALRNELRAQIDKLDTTVNPRYGTPELALVSAQGAGGQPLPLIVVPFAGGSEAPAVIDVP